MIQPLLEARAMYKISLVFWSMGELGILLLRFTDFRNGQKKIQDSRWFQNFRNVFALLLVIYRVTEDAIEMHTSTLIYPEHNFQRGRYLSTLTKFCLLLTAYLTLVDNIVGIPLLLWKKICIRLTFPVTPTYLFLST